MATLDRNATSIIDQLQSATARQRKVIQQMHAEQAKLLADLVEVRRERDAFRNEAAGFRRNLAEMQNRYDEVVTEYLDLKRERLQLLGRSGSASESNNNHDGHADNGARAPDRASGTLKRQRSGNKLFNPLSVVIEDSKLGHLTAGECTDKSRSTNSSPFSKREVRELPEPPVDSPARKDEQARYQFPQPPPNHGNRPSFLIGS